MRKPTGTRMMAAAAAAAAAGASFAAPVAAKAPPKLTVGVFDNYYAPIPKKAIKKGTVVRWKWDASTTDVHDVALSKAPKGVKRFGSDPLAAGQSYSKALKVPGTYKFICTFHEEMTMTLRVAKS